MTSSDERLWATLAHLAAVIAWVVSAGWLTFLGPLVLWLVFRDRSPFVRRAAAGAFNFQITMWLVGIVGWILIFTIFLLPIGIVLLVISGLGALIFGVVGAVKTQQGVSYTYPWHLQLLS